MPTQPLQYGNQNRERNVFSLAVGHTGVHGLAPEKRVYSTF
jgi:hypothetical protein